MGIAARQSAFVALRYLEAVADERVAFIARIVYLVPVFAAGGRLAMDGGR